MLSNSVSRNVFCSMSILNRILMHVTVVEPTGDDVQIRLKECEGEETIILDTTAQGPVYTANYSGLRASDMRKAYEVSVLVGGQAWGEAQIWSVEGHIKAAREKTDSDPEELALMNALLHYVDAVDAASN